MHEAYDGRMAQLFILIPIHLLAAIVYTTIVFTIGPHFFERLLLTPVLPSGIPMKITGEIVMIMVTVGFLMIESVKSVLTGWASITNHLLSTLLFVGAFGAFITQPAFGTVAWMVVTWSIFADMMIGFVVTTMSARRDLDVR